MKNILTSVKEHPLVDTLLHLKGNPKVCVLIEPLWAIPYNLYIPFATLYMYKLGVLDKQIGLILTIGMILQVFASLIGGIVNDKLGRRLTTLIFDLLSWSVPCIIWAFAQDFWWFLIAGMLNSMWQITNVSWTCLLVEDSEENQLTNIYMWIYISGLIAVFFAPISGILLGKWSLIYVMRGLYIFTAISMTAKFILLFFYSKETQIGIKKIEETKNKSSIKMLLEYKEIFYTIVTTKSMVKVILLITFIGIPANAIGAFFPLYIKENLLIHEKYLAYFPIIRAIVLIVFMFLVQHILDKFKIKNTMLVGIFILIITQIILILTPIHNINLIILYVFLEACAYGAVMPRRDVIVSKAIDPKERSRILSVINIIVIGISSPFGIINGYISAIDRRLPFVLCICFYIGVFIVVWLFKEIDKTDTIDTIETIN